MTTKQLNPVYFGDAIAMNHDEARAMLNEVRESDDSSFTLCAIRRGNEDAHFFRACTEYNLKKAVDIFDRADAKPKTYDIFYIIKANSQQTVHCMTVVAGCVKDAKTLVKYAVLRQTGHNAFTMTNGKLPTNWNWEYIAESESTTKNEIMAQAKANGYVIF